MNFNHFNEFRRFQQRQHDENSERADALVGAVCLVGCLVWAVLVYVGML